MSSTLYFLKKELKQNVILQRIIFTRKRILYSFVAIVALGVVLGGVFRTEIKQLYATIHLFDEDVIVHHIADLAGIPYVLLKNRMGMKKKRNLGQRSVWITDEDLQPKRRDSVKRKKRFRTSQDNIDPLIIEWISKKWT